jgi:hypothetical protein
LSALAGMLLASSAQAAEGEELPRLNLSRGSAHTPARPLGFYARTFGELSLGKGVRTNNPYRLGTTDPVGLTATYLDVGAGIAFGPPDGLEHGARVSLVSALDGIGQELIDLSYIALLPLGEHAMLRGRAGLPFVLNPDSTVGLEAGLGASWLFTGGIGVSTELVGSLFYGAATPERATTTIPVIALQLGAWFDYEVLP